MAARAKKEQRVGLAHPHLTPTYGDRERSMRITVAGMGDWANPASTHTCAECLDWAPGRGRGKGTCNLHRRRADKQGAAYDGAWQRACFSWKSSLGDAPGVSSNANAPSSDAHNRPGAGGSARHRQA
jgi:hypothetical protein